VQSGWNAKTGGGGAKLTPPLTARTDVPKRLCGTGKIRLLRAGAGSRTDLAGPGISIKTEGFVASAATICAAQPMEWYQCICGRAAALSGICLEFGPNF